MIRPMIAAKRVALRVSLLAFAASFLVARSEERRVGKEC